MKVVQETLEMTGIDERIGASVPVVRSRPRCGMMPRATRSRTSGTPTPSSPITATRDVAVRSPPPRRSRSRRPRLDLFLGHADDLGDGRDALAHRTPPVLAQRPHALPHGRLADDVGRGALQDQLPDLVGHREVLEDPRAPAVAGVPAVLAAPALDRGEAAVVPARYLAHRLEPDVGRLAALLADLPHEPLREHAE